MQGHALFSILLLGCSLLCAFLFAIDGCGLFVDQVEKQEFGLKPMNCPGHCLIFDHRVRSYRGKGRWISSFAYYWH